MASTEAASGPSGFTGSEYAVPDLAREADDAERVGPVRRHFEIEHGIVDRRASDLDLDTLDARELEAARRQRLAELFGRHGHVHEIAEPGDDDLHCLDARGSHSEPAPDAFRRSRGSALVAALSSNGNCSRKRRSFS